MSESSNNSNNSPVIKCESVYKIFGNNALNLLENSKGQVDAKKFPPDPKERVKRNLEEGRGFRLSNKLKDIGKRGGGNFEFASSNELWRASLDVIDFMPIATANYSGGIIVTDWYSDDLNSNESLKITIRFLSNEIRSDAIDPVSYTHLTLPTKRIV